MMKKLFLLGSILLVGLIVSCSKQELTEPQAPEIQAETANSNIVMGTMRLNPGSVHLTGSENANLYFQVWDGYQWVDGYVRYRLEIIDPAGLYNIHDHAGYWVDISSKNPGTPGTAYIKLYQDVELEVWQLMQTITITS